VHEQAADVTLNGFICCCLACAVLNNAVNTVSGCLVLEQLGRCVLCRANGRADCMLFGVHESLRSRHRHSLHPPKAVGLVAFSIPFICRVDFETSLVVEGCMMSSFSGQSG